MGEAFFLLCTALAVSAPAKYDAPNRQLSTSLLLRLRGGDATKLRPGTLDYSKWDEVPCLRMLCTSPRTHTRRARARIYTHIHKNTLREEK